MVKKANNLRFEITNNKINGGLYYNGWTKLYQSIEVVVERIREYDVDQYQIVFYYSDLLFEQVTPDNPSAVQCRFAEFATNAAGNVTYTESVSHVLTPLERVNQWHLQHSTDIFNSCPTGLDTNTNTIVMTKTSSTSENYDDCVNPCQTTPTWTKSASECVSQWDGTKCAFCQTLAYGVQVSTCMSRAGQACADLAGYPASNTFCNIDFACDATLTRGSFVLLLAIAICALFH